MTKSNKGLFYILFAELIWGVSPLATKLINHDFPVSLLVFLRYFLASLVLLIIILINKKLKKELLLISGKLIIGLIVLGVIGSGLAAFYYTMSIRMIGSGFATVVSNLEVPISIIFGILILKEKLSKNFLKIALLIIFGFVCLSIKQTGNYSLTSIFSLGVAYALITAVLWGSCTVIGKILLNKNISPFIVTFFRLFFGSMINLVIAMLTVQSIGTQFLKLSIFDFGCLMFLGIVASALGYVLYYHALQENSVKNISLLSTIYAVIAVTIGLLSGETMNSYQLIGSVAIICGIIFLIKDKENKQIGGVKNE